MSKDADIATLQELLDIQGSEGNWNHDPYMHGMLNGLILALSVLTEEEPEFAVAPAIFLEELEELDKFNNSCIIVTNMQAGD